MLDWLIMFSMDLACVCVKHQMRVSPNAFACVSLNASFESATELASIIYFCKLEFLFKEHSCLNIDSCLVVDSCVNTDSCLNTD